MGLGARDGDEERHVGTLKSTVEAIYAGIKATELAVSQEFGLTPFLPEQIHFVHSQELLSRYPELDAKGRERAIAKELGAVFLIGIGGKLSDGKRHDVRAPDYDDWSTEVAEGFAGLNGDIWCGTRCWRMRLRSLQWGSALTPKR